LYSAGGNQKPTEFTESFTIGVSASSCYRSVT